jgi:hypothetical protein
MDRMRELLRSGDWLTRERITLVAAAVLLASVFGFLFLVVTSHGAIDRQGRPLGTDFSNVYAAGTYVLDGNAAAAFDPVQQFARENRRRPGVDAVWFGACSLAGGHAGALPPRDMGDCLAIRPLPACPER